MLKKSVGIGLLCFASQAYSADITVTTTEDIVKDDDQCSLREAIEYVNKGLDKKGYMGCGGENSSNNILLQSKASYVLDKHITITKSVVIKAVSENDDDFNNTKILGLQNAHLKIKAKDNLLRILATDEELKVNLIELDLEGCGQNVCADQGGLIYNKGQLELKYSKLFNGFANRGGAIYNAAYYSNNKDLSKVDIFDSLLEKNNAAFGGVLYSELPSYTIGQSVIKQNTTTQNTAANIYSAGQVNNPADIQSILAKIVSSTLLKNSGTVVNVIDGVVLNNTTIVDNASTALTLNAPNAKAYISNNIILNNGNSDCQIASLDKSMIQNNLTSASCGTGNASYPNQTWTGSDLFASKSGSEGKCQSLAENSKAILCPYSVPEDSFLGYLRPRILLSYNAIDDSPIVNKGQQQNTTEVVATCESADQRSINRLSDNIYCDRGAIEIVVPVSKTLVGKNIRPGDQAMFSIASDLGDSDLIPKEQCKALLGENPTGKPWQDGCLKVVQTTTESKGTTTIDIEGNVVYTPNSNWHGSDIFEIQVITSSTRFNKTNPYLVLSTQVVQEPKNEMKDKSVKTSGGSWGFAGLLALLGLIGLRRALKD